MSRLNYRLGLVIISVAVMISLGTNPAHTQSPRFITEIPDVFNAPNRTLNISLPIKNIGTGAATNVLVTSTTLAQAQRITPTTFPVALGDMSTDASALIEASFNSSGLAVGSRYLLTARGTYRTGSVTYGFTVNRYITFGGIPELLDGAVIPTETLPPSTTIQYTTEQGAIINLEVIAGRVNALFNSGVTSLAAKNIIQGAGGLVIGKFPKIGLYLIEVDITNQMSLIETLRGEALVNHVWPAQPVVENSIMSPDEFNNPDLAAGSWHHDRIGTRGAWQLANNALLSRVDVGIIDGSFTGLREGQNDFGARLQNIPRGTIFESYHGTAVTAFCCARGDNGFGNVGVNWWSNVRTILANGATIPARFTSLVADGSEVINISLGPAAPAFCSATNEVFFNGLFATVNAITSFLPPQDRLLVVHAAGNDQCYLFDSILKPTNYLIVAATDINNQQTAYSNFGPLMDIAAPGGTDSNQLAWVRYGQNTVRTFTGTSFSAPLVTGAAALVMAMEPHLSAAQVAQRLKQTVDRPANYPNDFGAGVLNVGRALADFSITSSVVDVVSPGGVATYPVITSTTLGNSQTVNLSVSGLPSGATASFFPPSITSGDSSTLVVTTTASIQPGDSTLTITGTGITTTHSVQVQLTVEPGGCLPPHAGLISWWAGEGNANDSWDSNNGTLRGGLTFTAGKVGQAFNLDGVDDFVEIPHLASLNPTQEITVEAWVRLAALPPSGGGTSGWDVIIKDNPDRGPYALRVVSDGSVNFSVAPAGQAWQDVNSLTNRLTVNSFDHVAGTYKAANSELCVYVNGQGACRTILGNSLNFNMNSVRLGFDRFNNRYFKGIIDEVSIYNRVLSASEIQSIFNAGSAGKCSPGHL